MLDLVLVRRILEDFRDKLERNKDILAEALVFLDRLELEEYENKEEKEAFESDLEYLLSELEIELDECED
jgi:hypothetical protein